jgi:hypothetical protein
MVKTQDFEHRIKVISIYYIIKLYEKNNNSTLL